MTKPKIIHPITPDPRNKGIPGAYGHGVDLPDANGVRKFRAVIYAPQKFDDPSVLAHTQSEPAWYEKEMGKHDRGPRHQIKRPPEHGPAHVHIYDLESGHETRFELIEAVNQKDSFVLPLYYKTPTDQQTKPLTHDQVMKAKRLVKGRVNEFIQLWREIYQDTKLARVVSRVSEKDPELIERTYYRGRRGLDVVLQSPTNGALEEITFDDYIAR